MTSYQTNILKLSNQCFIAEHKCPSFPVKISARNAKDGWHFGSSKESERNVYRTLTYVNTKLGHLVVNFFFSFFCSFKNVCGCVSVFSVFFENPNSIG